VARVEPLSSVCGIQVASAGVTPTWRATLVVLVDMFLEKQGGAAGRAAVENAKEKASPPGDEAARSARVSLECASGALSPKGGVAVGAVDPGGGTRITMPVRRFAAKVCIFRTILARSAVAGIQCERATLS
jgi:hypothetical protein